MKRLTIAASEWVFGINDPSIIAWVIVFLYLTGVVLCWRAQLNFSVRADWGKRLLWMILGVFLLFLGLNKQLDLHDLVLGYVRDMSSSERQSMTWNAMLTVFAIATLGAAIWLGSKLLFHANRELGWVYLAFFTLLVFQVLRFAPGPAGGLLAGHPFTEEEGLFHVHYIELIELPILIVISFWAYRQSSPRDANGGSHVDELPQMAV